MTDYAKPLPTYHTAPRSALFWHHLKSGGTSVHAVFGKYGNLHVADSLDCLVQQPANDIRDGIAAYGFDYRFEDFPFVFCFLRNPWDRLASLWSIWNRGRPEGMTVDHLLYIAGQPGVRQGAHIRFRSDYELWRHTRPARAAIIDRCHFVGRFENLQSEWQYACDQIGIEEQLPQLNASPASIDYRALFTAKQRDVVARLYSFTIDKMGYEF